MNQNNIKIILDEITGEFDSITVKKAMSIIKVLINLVEMFAERDARFKEEVQQLKDEINRLKGEQGQPDIRRQSKGGDKTGDSNHSSEAERNKRGGKKERKPKDKKSQTVRVDRRVTVEFDKTTLPDDAIFKGYEYRTIQDLKITTDNVEFQLPVYYSASLKKTFIAPMPEGYKGSEFGPGLKSLVITFYRDSGMSIPAIERFLKTFNIHISRSTISDILSKGHDDFHQEKEDIFNAGMNPDTYQQVDDTGSRVNGQNHYTHIFCNPLFTAYFTRKSKDRLTLLDILCRGELKYAFNKKAWALMAECGLAKKWLEKIEPMLQVEVLTRENMDTILVELFPKSHKHRRNRRIILESTALAYYQQSGYYMQYLMSDDAPQFNKLALYHGLCWVHEGRHYKKLNPLSDMNRFILDAFINQFWDYYDALLTYKEAPSLKKATELSEQFDTLFTMTTGYEALDIRIKMTRQKKKALLLVLNHSFFPLHNNGSELGARVQARMRDINLQTISDEGTKCKDTFATIVQTAKKMNVNIYQYIYDRISKKYEMPSLSDMIEDALKSAPNYT